MASNNIYFTFIGQPVIPRSGELVRKYERTNSTGKKVEALSLNFGVRDDSNSFYVDAYDYPVDEVLTYNTNGDKISVDWDDRLDDDVINSVASYRRYYANLTGERKTFITVYDLIQYIVDELPNYTGDVVVTGQYRISPNMKQPGSLRTNFTINSIRAAKEDEKRRFSMVADLYYNKSSVDKSSVKADGKVRLDCYVPMYVSKDEGTKFFPMPTVFNTAVYNMENERHKALYEHKMSYIDIKQSAIQHITWELRCINGAQEVPFSEDMLTKAQRAQVMLGERTLEDFRPSRGVVGERITEFRLFEPVLRGDFADGLVDSGWSANEFEDQIYHFVEAEDVDEVIEKVSAKKVETETVEDEDLFF